MKRKVFIISEFPSLHKPTYFSWIKTRVEALKGLYDVAVISIQLNRQQNQITKTDHDGFTLYTISIKKMNIPKVRMFYYEFYIKKLFHKLIIAEQPDLMHVHFSSYFSWLIRDAAKKFHIPYCITEHASYFENVMKLGRTGRKVKTAIDDADKVFAVSSALKQTMQKYTRRSIEVKFNIVDTDKFYPQSHTVDRDYIYMSSVGSLDVNDKKGYELLVRALSELKRDGFTFRCDIVGEGPNRFKLQQMIDQFDLADNVTLIGSISNDMLADYYNSIDFFVSSSRIETFGVAIVEAMSCGVPVLATKSGGPQDYMNDVVGVLVDSESWESLYDGIKQMVASYKDFNRQLIRQYVVEHFSTKSYATKMKKAYEELLR